MKVPFLEKRKVSSILRGLIKKLDLRFYTLNRAMLANDSWPEKYAELHPLLATIAGVTASLAHLQAQQMGAKDAFIELNSIGCELNQKFEIHSQTGCSFIEEWAWLNRQVLNTREKIAHLLKSGSDLPSQLEIPTDLLFQAYNSLFPAERMLVVAGRRKGQSVSLGAVFDVTGKASSGHVRSGPETLANSLIAMSKTGSHLAAWIHSHPGRGIHATHPSSIDVDQHAKWIQNYTPDLLGAILVADRFVRFWGTALQQGNISLHFLGIGIRQEDDHVYKLE